MAYKRKTEDEWTVKGLYNGEWEDLTTETSFKAGKARLREYVANQPGILYKLSKKRVKIELKAV